MDQVGIYGIRNTANGKWYVGQTIGLRQRKASHYAALRHGRHRNRYLQSSFVKHGEACFEWRVLELCAVEMLDIRECVWITYYKSDQMESGYNLESGGRRAQVTSAETRAKQSAAKKGKPLSPEHRAKLSAVMRGRVMTPEHCAALSKAGMGHKMPASVRAAINAAVVGKPLSDEVKLKISEATKGRPKSEETKRRMSVSLRARWTPERKARASAYWHARWVAGTLKLPGRVRPVVNQSNGDTVCKKIAS